MFDPKAYGGEIAAILALDGDGQRLMPLVQGKCSSQAARERVKAAQVAPAVRAGLYLYFDCWDDAHNVAQDVNTPEGSYWHAIVHRQEPDPGNAAYWFRQVGAHPVYESLASLTGAPWDPLAFVAECGRATPGSAAEQKARELQRAEWQLLFDYCAR